MTTLARLARLCRQPRFLLLAAVLLALPIPAGGWLRDILVTRPQEAATARSERATAEASAAAVADAVARWRIALSAVAAREDTRAALAAAGTGAVKLSLTAEFPDATEVIATARAEDLPAGAFVAQQLARKVLSGTASAIAALKSGTSPWQVVLAAQIPESGQPRGALLVTLPATALARAVAFDPAQAQMTLLQQIHGAPPQPILTQGAGDRPPVVVPVPNIPDWQVSVRLSDSTAQQHRIPGLAFAVTLLPWLLAIAVLVVGARRLLHGAVATPIPESAPTALPTRRTAVITSSERTPDAPAPAAAAEPVASPAPEASATVPLPGVVAAEDERYPAAVFRDYDIRGASASQITPTFAEALGKALGSLVQERGAGRVAVGRDGRIGSPALCNALIEGLIATGCDVVDVGMVPTPVLSFAAARLPSIAAAAMVTASHNPAGDNGFKILVGTEVLQGSDLQELRRRMLAQDWRTGAGKQSITDVRESYMQAVLGDIATRTPLSVVVDCGNGVAGDLAPRLLEALGCNPIPLYCDVDGNFPNHPPDPLCPANLEDLRKAVVGTGADLGIALDGDGDRLVAVTGSGRVVWPDELLMIFARDILPGHPGANIVFDVKSTRRLTGLVSGYGGQPVMCRTGHSHLRTRVAELKAPLGGEFSGHIFFADRWLGCDDGLYAAARLIEILCLREQSLDSVLAAFETAVATPEIRLSVSEADKFSLIERIRAAAVFEDARIDTLDGLRVEFAGGWGLVRASHTESAVSLRFEADDASRLVAIQQRFRDLFATAAPELAGRF